MTLAMVRSNQETVESNVANALQVVELTKPYEMSPRQVEDHLLRIAARLMTVLTTLRHV